jgi:universal stress protein A
MAVLPTSPTTLEPPPRTPDTQAVAPAEGHGAIRRVMLATDLTRASSLATERAIELAAGLRAELLVVNVIGPDSMRRDHGDPRVDQVRADRERAMTGVVELGRRRGVATTFLIWTGDPADSLVEAADAERADLIVIGSRGRGGATRAVLGSVSDHVVRHAGCPVLVVREGSIRPD